MLSCGLMICDILADPLDERVFSVDTAHLDSVQYSSGGDALNVAVDSAKLGLKVCMGGCIGNDMTGDFLLGHARKYGIAADCVERLDSAGTAVSIILRDAQRERHFACYLGANAYFDGSGISDELLAGSSLVYIGSAMALERFNGKPLAELFKRAKACGTLTAMDATATVNGLWLPNIEEALPYTDIFIPSLSEAKMICGTEQPEEIVAFLNRRGVRIAGVKLGERGIFIDGKIIPAMNSDCVADTTGAGDSFMAGFCAACIRGCTVQESAWIGSSVASFCIRKTGATEGVPDYETAASFAEEFQKNLMGD